MGHSNMRASEILGLPGGSNQFYHQYEESYSLPQNLHDLGHCFPDNRHQMSSFPFLTELCTLDSSLDDPSCNIYNSSSLRFSPEDRSSASQQDSHSCLSETRNSPANVHGSPLSGSCITDASGNIRHKLKELEIALLGPDSDVVDESFDSTVFSGHAADPEMWRQFVEMSEGDLSKGDLRQVLIAYAKAVAENDVMQMEWLMLELRHMVSVSGEPIQRLGAYLLEGLVARIALSGSSIYKALLCKQPASEDLLSYMHILYEACPYFKFGYMSANGAIAEAVKDENYIHIVDFQIAQGSQWPTLIQALATRPGGPPHIRMTGIDDSMSAYARGSGLQVVEQRLSRLAESLNMPFEFIGLEISGCDVEEGHLQVRPGEALAVNFAFQLHHMPDESVSTQNHRDRILRMVKSLNPKVVTLVEQESNTNTAPFFPRFMETLEYYMAIFESIDVTLPRDSKDRINVEQHCLARDIVNIIACEGLERVERHEVFGKWHARFIMAGFTPYPLSSFVNATIKALLEKYCEKYRLEERSGVLYLGWMNRDLVVSCAWR